MVPEMGVCRYRRWIVLTAAVCINMTMGVNYSWSVIKKALVNDWQWSHVSAALPYAVYTIIFSSAMVLGGRLQDTAGPRIAATLGSFFIGAGLLFCSFVTTPSVMVLTYSLTGIGFAFCFSATMPASIKWFPHKRKGVISGIVVSGSALAAAYFSPLISWLLAHYGISDTFLVLGVGVFIVTVLFSQLLHNPSRHSSDCDTPVPAVCPATRDITWYGMIRTRAFYKLWLMFLCIASACLMIVGHIVTIAETQAGWKNGFYLITVFALLNTIGRLISGYFSDRYGRRPIFVVVFLLQAANLLMFVTFITPALLIVGMMIVGFSFGASFALFPLATADHYGLKYLGSNYGLIFTAYGTGGLVGPLIAGWVVDGTGSFFYAYILSAATLMAALALFMTEKQKA